MFAGAPSRVDLPLTLGNHSVPMAYIELIPERRPNGTIVLRAVRVGPAERLRRLLRRVLAGPPRA